MSLHGCGVVDLAHEQDAPGGVLQEEDHERPVKFHDFWHAHGHDLGNGAGSRRCSCLIDAQGSAMRNLVVGKKRLQISVLRKILRALLYMSILNHCVALFSMPYL